MKKITKKYIIILSLLIVLSILAVIGVTYASIIKKETQTGSNVISTLKCLDISIVDEQNHISLTNAYPISDVQGMKQTPYSFIMRNNCDYKVEVVVLFEPSTSSTLNDQYLKVSFDGETPRILSSYESTTPISGRNSYILRSERLLELEETPHTFNMWLDYDTTKEQANGKTLTGKIIVKGVYKKSSAPYTLEDLIINDNKLSETDTIPGKRISNETEEVFAKTKDDYGTSYYYRGNVQNNYLLFADMCWRVVRTTGNGGVKLVLYNHNNPYRHASNPCSSRYDSTSASYAEYEEDTYNTQFNSTYNQNTYIGLMYGNPGSSTYASEHQNTNNSTILTNLENWYTNVLSQKLDFNENLLKDVIWCNDKSTFTTFTSGVSAGGGEGYGALLTKYSTTQRLNGGNAILYANPSLICPNDNNGGKLSKFTVDDTTNGNGKLNYKIGLLTADEVAFAGGKNDDTVGNTSYYLYNNATEEDWWTLSPGDFSNSKASQWSVTFDGMITTASEEYSLALRPSIVLDGSVIATGSGTSEDPYYIVD